MHAVITTLCNRRSDKPNIFYEKAVYLNDVKSGPHPSVGSMLFALDAYGIDAELRDLQRIVPDDEPLDQFPESLSGVDLTQYQEGFVWPE